MIGQIISHYEILEKLGEAHLRISACVLPPPADKSAGGAGLPAEASQSIEDMLW